MTTENQSAPTSWAELPATITKYLTAHRARDTATAIAALAADSVVADEGRTYRGLDKIRAWLTDAVSGYLPEDVAAEMYSFHR